MLNLNFNNLIPDPKAEAELKKKIEQYVYIMSIRDPMNKTFQDEFAKFYQLNNSGWKSPSVMRPLFFNVFSAFNEMYGKGYKLSYDMVITMLSRISGMTEKSFSSKILHTFDTDEPIIDSQLIEKIHDESISNFKAKTGYCYSVYTMNLAMVIDLHNCLKEYYDILKSYQSTISYINDFDNWCNSQGINPSLISDTKKIDFWMWLA